MEGMRVGGRSCGPETGKPQHLERELSDRFVWPLVRQILASLPILYHSHMISQYKRLNNFPNRPVISLRYHKAQVLANESGLETAGAWRPFFCCVECGSGGLSDSFMTGQGMHHVVAQGDEA